MSTSPAPPAVPTPEHPVRIWADPDPDPSRLLWLVKWLLLIPHYFILLILWVAVGFVTIVAFFAILFTKHYPMGMFQFTVGVLRWSWRVSYYGYSALGTDRYPPFRLDDDPGYPAHLEVAYPYDLSRGLVLVKWWLLAIPHYLIVGILLGNGSQRVTLSNGETEWISAGPGLIPLLVLFAAVIVAFTTHYPRPLHALVVGLNRWVMRVGTYALLLTDVYPPMRLDQGADEPGPVVAQQPAPPPGE